MIILYDSMYDEVELGGKSENRITVHMGKTLHNNLAHNITSFYLLISTAVWLLSISVRPT